jgi:hypothetical protein
MNVLQAAYLTAHEKRGASVKGVLGGIGAFAASIPAWSLGSSIADKATGGEKVDRENVYLPGPLFRRVMEQQRQAKLKENMTTGKKGV